MSRIHHSRLVSTWLIDAYHSGIVYDYRPGQYRYIIETRIGRALRHTSEKSFGSERDAVKEMFLSMGVEPPVWSKAGGEE